MYYGKVPQFEQYLTDSFTSNATTYASGYPLTYDPGLAQAVEVTVAGIVQRANMDYVLVGKTLVFSPAPPDNLSIFIRYLGMAGVVGSVIQDASVTPSKISSLSLSKAVTGGTVVLTGTEGSAYNAYEFTGTLTSNATIQYPANIKGFQVTNKTTGNFSLIIATATGKPVTIPQGASSYVYCDSLDMYGSSGGNNGAFFENDQIISSSYTIPVGKNAMTAGPITIATGVTVTVSTGSTWTIV